MVSQHSSSKKQQRKENDYGSSKGKKSQLKGEATTSTVLNFDITGDVTRELTDNEVTPVAP